MRDTPPGCPRDPATIACAIAVALLASAMMAAPLWVGRFLPLLDLPQHLAITTVLLHHDDPAWQLAAYFEPQRGELTPYWAHYLALEWLGRVMPVDVAARVFLTLYVFALPWAAMALARALGRPPALGLLAIPLALNANLYYGFIAYCWSVVAAAVGARPPGAPARCPARRRAPPAWRCSPGRCSSPTCSRSPSCSWPRAVLACVGDGPAWRRAAPRLAARPGDAGPVPALAVPEHDDAAGRGALLSAPRRSAGEVRVPAPASRRPSRRGRRLVPGRHRRLAARRLGDRRRRGGAGAARPERRRDDPAARRGGRADRGGPRLLLRAAGLHPGTVEHRAALRLDRRAAAPLPPPAAAALASRRDPRPVRRDGGERGLASRPVRPRGRCPFDRALATLPPGARVLGLIYDPRGQVLERWPYLHFEQYAVVRGGGVAAHSFTANAPLPVRLRPEARVPAPAVWRPRRVPLR